MNLTTWWDEQARLVRVPLMNGSIAEARNALRFTFEDMDDNRTHEGIRPDLIVRLALFPLTDAQVRIIRDEFIKRSAGTFADDALDQEIRAALFSALYRERNK